jgi:23S rRNA pseudouridine1911/1915/1917 synthase
MSSDPDHILKAGPEASGVRLDKWLAAQLAPMSRSRVRGLIEAGRVRLCREGAAQTIAEADHSVKPGDEYAVHLPPPAGTDIAPEPIALDILHEDDDLIVINKPAGMVVHPAPGNTGGTLVNALLAHCGPGIAEVGSNRRPGIVHRLDKDTSGVMVAAKSEAAYHGLVALFAEHDIERQYQAVVWGVPNPLAGSVDAAIGRHTGDRKKMAVAARGKPAVTHYAVRQVFAGLAALVDCRLESGRTHQIRVHMASIGHPIIGDATYGRARPERRRRLEALGLDVGNLAHRQALHARILGFQHPVTGEPLYFERDFPSDMHDLISALATAV